MHEHQEKKETQDEEGMSEEDDTDTRMRLKNIEEARLREEEEVRLKAIEKARFREEE